MKIKELRERDQSILRGHQMICPCRNQKIWNHNASRTDYKCSKCLGTLRVVLPTSELSDYTEYDPNDWLNVPRFTATRYTDLNAETPDT